MKKLVVFFMLLTMSMLAGQSFAIDDKQTSTNEKFTLTSPAFKDGERMPYRYNGRGPNKSPALKWQNVPEGTVNFSITCIDYDPPANGYVHWDIKNIPATYTDLPEGIPSEKKWKDGIIQNTTWTGPYPPNGMHSYHFVIQAKDANGKTLAKAELIGRSD